MDVHDHKNELIKNELKVTPQRLSVLEAITDLKNHPTADNIISYIKTKHPNVGVGTIYNTLDLFVKKGIIHKVKTEKDVMRYDGILEKHHHLYSSESEQIEDYFDENLNTMIEDYFIKKKIPGFKIEEVKVQIIGKFKKK
jgi:Fur family transcriptional regulator, peroxide stress response regulator